MAIYVMLEAGRAESVQRSITVRTAKVQFPVSKETFLYSAASRPGLNLDQPPIAEDRGLEADHSPLPKAEVKNSEAVTPFHL
jgi:hypothetical protein